MNIKQIDHLFKNLNIGLWSYHADSNEWWFSEQCKTLLKDFNFKDSMEDLSECVLCDDKNIFLNLIHHVKTSPSSFSISFRLQNKQRSKLLWLSVKSVLEKHKNNNVLLGTINESSVPHSMVARYSHAMATNDMALEAGNIGIWSCRISSLVNKNNNWQFDTRARQILHLVQRNAKTYDEWTQQLGKKDLVHIKKVISDALESNTEGGSNFQFEYKFETPTHNYKYILATGSVNTDPNTGDKRIDGTFQDKTFERVAQYELQRLNASVETRVQKRTELLEKSTKLAESANEAKGNFLAMMSHELRTPMNAIIGSLDLLAMEQFDSEQLDLVETSKSSSINLVRILNDILDFTKVESGNIELERIPMRLSDVIESIVNVFQPVANAKNVRLCVFEDPLLPKVVMGDPTRLRQILYNLMSNAIKFSSSESNQPKIVELHVCLRQKEKYLYYVEFCIIDFGIGMTESTIKTLFTPFKQAEKSTLRKFGGTGLGLSICYKLVNLMGGKINVTSTVGEGSKFYCDLPFSLAKLIPAELQQANYANISVVYNHQQNEKCAKSISLITSLENNGIRIVNHDALPVDEMDDINLALIICRTEADIIQVNRLVYGCPEALPVVICSHYPINLFSKITQKRSTFLLFDNLTVNKLTATITQKIATSSATKSLDEVDLDEKLSLDERLSLDEKLSFDEKLIFDDDFTLISDIKNAAPELNARLLVVEDNPVNQKLIAKQLQKLNLTFLMASNGFEGLAYWQTYSPKLILTDCHMPEMNGFDMSREIRKREKMQLSNKTRVSIIAITGATLTGDEQLCIEAGMDDFLSKPIQLKTLKNMLNKWIPNELPILSHNVLIDFIGNDKNSINEFYIEFMQQADTSMKFLTMHFNARNFEKISEEAHFLKTSAMAIGAQRTGQILHILEDKAREKSTKECYRELVALKTTLIALKSSIANHLNQA